MAVLQRKDESGKVVGYFAVVNYRTHDGQRKQIRKNASNSRAAEKLEREFLNKRDASDLPGQKVPPAPEQPTPETLTVASYLEAWLAGRRNIRESTVTRYHHAIVPVTERLGTVPLSDLTPDLIDGIYEFLRLSGKAEKTVLNVHRVLKKALGDAVRRDVLARNAAERVEAPRAPAAEIFVLSRGELDRLLAAADATTIGPIIRLAAFTGLRLGEMLALKWSDIEGNRLTVRRMLNAAGTIDEPKSRRSRRTLTISEGTLSVLQDVRAQQLVEMMKAPAGRDGKSLYDDQGFVFTDPLGKPHPQFHVNHIWRTVRKTAKVERARIHDLRHCHASHLLADGWALADVAERLGHSRTSITLDFYSHSLPGRDAALADAVDRIFGAK